MYRLFSALLILCILLQTSPVAWAAPIPVTVDTAQVGPDLLASYTFPGEKAFTLSPGLEYQGKRYQIHYFTTGDFHLNTSQFIYLFTDASFLQENAITGMLVTTDDGIVVEDEAVLRELFILYRSAYYLYENHGPASLGYVDDEFADEMRTLATITQFITLSFPQLTDASAEALRLLFTPRLKSPGQVTDFGDSVAHIVETGETVIDAVDLELTNARFSNNKSVRQAGEALREAFVDWKILPDDGKKVSLAGRLVNLGNGLSLISLGADLMWQTEMQKDRADWLAHYQEFASGEAALNQDQSGAAQQVVSEVGNQWLQRWSIIRNFVIDESVDWLVDKSAEAVVETWAKVVWKWKGTRIVGHNVAGLASNVMLGVTIGSLLYGLEDVNECFWLGIRLDDFRRRFRDGRVALEEQTGRQSMLYYDGEMSREYRSAYMLESLAAARMMSSYADGVDATVRDNLISFLNPIKWFKGKEWQEAAAELRTMSVQTEQEAEDTLGHPPFIDAALESLRTRLSQIRFLVDDSSSLFTKFGPAGNWQTMAGGFAGSTTWTYNEAITLSNHGRWQPDLAQEGLYKIETYIPAPATPELPPYTSSAVYTLYHFGRPVQIKRSLQQFQGGWIDLGVHYLESNGEEYVELGDLTSEQSAKTIVVFDVLRLTPQSIRDVDYQADPGLGLVYATALPGETVTLKFKITNSGPMPWKESGDYTFRPDNALKDTLPVFPINQTVLPGDSLEFTLDIPVDADAIGGLETIQYVVARSGVTLENPARGYIFVLPPQLKDYKEKLDQKIEEWQQQGEQAIEDLIRRIMEDIQRELASQVEKQFNDLITQCLSPVVMLGGLAITLGRRMRSKHG